MDITALVLKHEGPKQSSLSVDKLNGFLQEAYQINSRISELISYLRTIRQPYLSTAPPPRRQRFAAGNVQQPKEHTFLTNAQRDQIDAEVKATLRDVHAAVRTLQEAEKVRQGTESALIQKKRQKKGFGALGQWAAGGALQQKNPEDEAEDAATNTVNAHREGVIWFLQRKLEECGKEQSEMMETRISREVEKSKSVLQNSKTSNSLPTSQLQEAPGTATNGRAKETQKKQKRNSGFGVAFGTDDKDEQALTEAQLQLLAEENQGMLRLYEDRLDQVRTAEKSLNEISDLQTTLAMNLAEQSAHIEQLVQDSFYAVDNVSGGNKQLQEATKRKSTARMLFYGTAALCSAAVVWDLIF